MFAEGQVLQNTYRIVRLIGEGGMGVVYEATHARLAGRYAIKVLLRKLSENPEALARFDREARITSTLQHPNIVQVIDFNTHTDGTEYLVMEYLQGETLADRLALKGALPMEIVIGIVEQVAAGLAAAHAHGVVHRDLKPENVFLVPIEGRQTELAKVLDFGISKITDTNRGLKGPESTLMGTPQYMSPEQCRGRAGEVDAATDQFALAVITYEMLTGHPPFQGDSVGTVLSQVLYADPPPMNMDPDLEQVVRRGLAKAKEDRYPTVTAFATALRTVVASLFHEGRDLAMTTDPVGELTAVGSDDTLIDSRRPAGRPRRRGWSGVMIAAGAVAVTLFFVVGARRLESGRRHSMLPAPVIQKQRIVDFALQPPKLPSLTATTAVPATGLELPPPIAPTAAADSSEHPGSVPSAAEPAELVTGTTATGGVSSVAQPTAATADDAAAAKDRAAAASRASASTRRQVAARRESRPEVVRPVVAPPAPTTPPPATVRPTAPPPSPNALLAPTFRTTTRKPPPADEDAVLPLDDSLVETP